VIDEAAYVEDVSGKVFRRGRIEFSEMMID
jgi:hypothetical protein